MFNKSNWFWKLEFILENLMDPLESVAVPKLELKNQNSKNSGNDENPQKTSSNSEEHNESPETPSNLEGHNFIYGDDSSKKPSFSYISLSHIGKDAKDRLKHIFHCFDQNHPPQEDETNFHQDQIDFDFEDLDQDQIDFDFEDLDQDQDDFDFEDLDQGQDHPLQKNEEEVRQQDDHDRQNKNTNNIENNKKKDEKLKPPTYSSILYWMKDKHELKIPTDPKNVDYKKLWTTCDHCGRLLYIRHLREKLRICKHCKRHLQMNSPERIQSLIDTDTWTPLNDTLSPCNPLDFHDRKTYAKRLRQTQSQTKLQDAILTGTGLLDGIPIALGVMDFNFMGGSMGSVVGEKITRLIEHATREGYFLILICASGGARMQEGVLSLMQMAKITSALRIYSSAVNLPYFSILTSPTTGGVTASFGMLGDLIFTEPDTLIGFAGRRVIDELFPNQEFPEDFQTSEYYFNHGLCDLIIPRVYLKQALSEMLSFYEDTPFKKCGQLPTNIKYEFDFLTEERIRRNFISEQEDLKTDESENEEFGIGEESFDE